MVLSMNFQLKEQERLDNLINSPYRIIQLKNGPSLGTYTVLLTNFARVRDRDGVIDLGTGVGAIPLLIAMSSKARKIVGIEIQERLAEVANRNLLLNHIDDRVKIVRGDIRNVGNLFVEREFDLAVANPPYKELGRGLMSSADADLVAKHEVSCTMEDIIKSCRHLVKSKGRIVLSYRPERLVDLLTLLRRFLFEPKRMRFVHSYEGGEAKLVLVEAVREGGSGLRVMSSLFVHSADGSFTQEVKDIYSVYQGY